MAYLLLLQLTINTTTNIAINKISNKTTYKTINKTINKTTNKTTNIAINKTINETTKKTTNKTRQRPILIIKLYSTYLQFLNIFCYMVGKQTFTGFNALAFLNLRNVVVAPDTRPIISSLSYCKDEYYRSNDCLNEIDDCYGLKSLSI